MPLARFVPPRPALAAAVLVLAAAASQAGGLDIHTEVGADEIGLPVYPGATRDTDDDGKTNGISLGLWGSGFGVKLAVASFHSPDNVATIALYYRQAMRRYGQVLDCTVAAKAAASAADKSGGADLDFSSRTPVSCGNESVAAGGRLFKVGTHASQHTFKATPDGTGTRFELVRLEGHADE